jgi:hypothetical protein
MKTGRQPPLEVTAHLRSVVLSRPFNRLLPARLRFVAVLAALGRARLVSEPGLSHAAVTVSARALQGASALRAWSCRFQVY